MVQYCKAERSSKVSTGHGVKENTTVQDVSSLMDTNISSWRSDTECMTLAGESLSQVERHIPLPKDAPSLGARSPTKAPKPWGSPDQEGTQSQSSSHADVGNSFHL